MKKKCQKVESHRKIMYVDSAGPVRNGPALD